MQIPRYSLQRGRVLCCVVSKIWREGQTKIICNYDLDLGLRITRKVYTLLGMPVENIYADFTSYDLIGENNNEIIKQLTDMKFEVIIGNPPYQEEDGGAGASAKPIYNQFVDVSKEVLPSYLCIIMPSRWMAGGKGLDEFRSAMLNDKHIVELHDFMHPEDVFPQYE